MLSCQQDKAYLGIVNQYSTPLIELLHDLQNGHLDINLYTLLHIRHLADPNRQDKSSQETLPWEPNSLGIHTYELRTSLVFFCSVACLSPRRFTREANSLRWFLTASSKNWYLKSQKCELVCSTWKWWHPPTQCNLQLTDGPCEHLAGSPGRSECHSSHKTAQGVHACAHYNRLCVHHLES